MKLLSRDIPVEALLARASARLRRRHAHPPLESSAPPASEPELRVDPTSFFLGALEDHADPTRPLPLETHRSGVGRLVLVAKWGFRKSCQVFVNEVLGRQRLFNGHARDAYLHLSVQVLALQEEVNRLKAQGRR